MTIKEIRLLPTLAFARFGSAPEPQANYTLEENSDDPLGFRRIVPTDNLIVGKDGTISVKRANSKTDLASIFRDRKGRIRPVAPFFELYVVTDKENLEPLTLNLIADQKLPTPAVEWAVHVENRKVFRRTGDPNDIVVADTDWFSGHARQPLRGKCNNFDPNTAVNFGTVRFVIPTMKSAVCSQIRTPFYARTRQDLRPRRTCPSKRLLGSNLQGRPLDWFR